MGYDAKTERLISIKKLSGKAQTSNDKGLSNEGLPSGITMASATVFGASISTNPPTAALYDISGSVEYVRFTTTFIAGTDTSDGRHGFELTLPSDYESNSSNSKAGTYPYINSQKINITSGSLQLIPPSFATTYEVTPYYGGSSTKGSGTVIPVLDVRDWYFDYFNGIFFQQDPSGTGDQADNPDFVEGYLYIGDMLSTVVSNATGSGGTVTSGSFNVPSVGEFVTTASVSIAGGKGFSYTADSVGTDAYFFVSGTVGAKDGATAGVGVFGGDLVVSGGLDVAGGTVFSIDGVGASNVTTDSGNLTLSTTTAGNVVVQAVAGAVDIDADSGTLSLDGSGGINIGTGGYVAVDLNADTLDIDALGAVSIDSLGGLINIGTNDNDFNISIGTAGGRIVTLGNTTAGQVRLKGGAAYGIALDSPGGVISLNADGSPPSQTDVNFFVSGSIGSLGTAVRGTSVFGGDMMVSGTLVAIRSDDGAYPAIKIDKDYSGTTTVGNYTTDSSGLLIDYDVTGIVASGQTAIHDGIAINFDQGSVKHVGTINSTGLDLRMSGSTDGVQAMKGVAINMTGADTNTGIDITVPNDGTHFIARSPDNILDFFKISVGESGATTMTTSDQGATAADLTLAVDGDIILGPAGGDVLPDADNSRSLGSASYRWANVYTGDLHLQNERGNWTVIEEENYLSLRNNKTGKKFKIMMELLPDDD
jgi:hypothetical protein